MALRLCFHPLSSFCHKVLIALCENETAFKGNCRLERRGPAVRFCGMWPLGKIPLLRDEGRLVPETTIMIEYLDRHYPGARPLLPKEAESLP